MIYIDAKHYPSVYEHFQQPRNIGVGDAIHYQAVKMGDMQAGYVLHWCMHIEQDKILDVRYRVYGCAFQIACCSWLSEQLQQKQLTEMPASISQLLIAVLELPREKWHCAYVCEDACQAILAKQT